MKINLMSDLHLNFSDLNLPGGDILLLAGDVVEAGHIRKAINAKKDTHLLDRYKRFFDEECGKYNQVFYTFGNHEHYNSDINESEDWIAKVLAPNVVVLQDSWAKVEDVYFYGSTFWTDVNSGNPMTLLQADAGMTDFRCIDWKRELSDKDYTSRFSAKESVRLHKQSVSMLSEWLQFHRQDKVVVMTHHAPHELSVPDHFSGHPLNPCYFSDQINLILDNPAIKAWVHGHIHDLNDYSIGSTRILSNPRGYKDYEDRADRFDPSFSFEI